jgi:hypothetical protein
MKMLAMRTAVKKDFPMYKECEWEGVLGLKRTCGSMVVAAVCYSGQAIASDVASGVGGELCEAVIKLSVAAPARVR